MHKIAKKLRKKEGFNAISDSKIPAAGSLAEALKKPALVKRKLEKTEDVVLRPFKPLQTAYQAYKKLQQDIVPKGPHQSREIQDSWARLTAIKKLEFEAVSRASMEDYWSKHPEDRPANATKRKRKKVRDPNAPKRPLTAYLRFCNDFRQSVINADPDCGMTDVMKRLSEMWKEASAKTKAKYKKLYENEKISFDREMAMYRPPPDEYEEERKKRIKLDPNRPKGRKSAFIFFGDDVRARLRANNEKMDQSETLKYIAAEWKMLSSKKKKKYAKLAKKDSARYKSEMSEYSPPPPPAQSAKETLRKMVEAHEHKMRKQSKVKRERGSSAKVNDPNRPKRPLTAYLIFMGKRRKEVKASNPDFGSKKVMTIVAAEWSELSEDARRIYKDKAYEAKKIYLDQMANYTPPDPPNEVDDKSTSRSQEDPKSKKPKTDPNAPKRPQSSYLLFCNAHRKKIADTNKGISAKDVTKKLGSKWRAMSDSQKQKWQKKAAVLKADYDKVRAAYEKTKEYAEWKSKTQKPSSSKKNVQQSIEVVPPYKRALQIYSEAKYDKVKLKNPDVDETMIRQILKNKFEGLSGQRRMKYDNLEKEAKEAAIASLQMKKKKKKKKTKE